MLEEYLKTAEIKTFEDLNDGCCKFEAALKDGHGTVSYFRRFNGRKGYQPMLKIDSDLFRYKIELNDSLLGFNMSFSSKDNVPADEKEHFSYNNFECMHQKIPLFRKAREKAMKLISAFESGLDFSVLGNMSNYEEIFLELPTELGNVTQLYDGCAHWANDGWKIIFSEGFSFKAELLYTKENFIVYLKNSGRCIEFASLPEGKKSELEVDRDDIIVTIINLRGSKLSFPSNYYTYDLVKEMTTTSRELLNKARSEYRRLVAKFDDILHTCGSGRLEQAKNKRYILEFDEHGNLLPEKQEDPIKRQPQKREPVYPDEYAKQLKLEEELKIKKQQEHNQRQIKALDDFLEL